MKGRFALFMILGLWIMCISACGREEAADGEALGAGDGSALLADGAGSEDGAATGRAEDVSGEEHRRDAKEPGSAENAGNGSEEGGSQGTMNPEGSEDVSEASGSVPEEGGTAGQSGTASGGQNGGRQSGTASNGQNGGGQRSTASSGQNAAAQTAALGALSVEGTKLVDGKGNEVQLRGISTHGLAWYPDYVNEDCVRQLKEEWGMNVFRLAMYTAEYGGYCSGGDKEDLKALVKDGVKYGTENDMYVIIDWHILSDGNPNTYLEDAKGFFEEMSKEYADYTNVLYEICNEPNGGTSWSDVKSYAEKVIEVIRGNDEDGIILVGTPNWCQYVEQAAEDPIEGYENIMYTLHFYAATHKEDLRQAMVRAVESGLPVFVSEYGICDASGSGGIDEYQANQWVELLDQHQISYVAWNLSNKSETSAVIKNSCVKTSGFTQEDLSESGKWLYNMLGTQGALGSDNSGANQGDSGSGGAGQGKTLTQGELSLSIQQVNSWGQGGDSFYQYTLTITNPSETSAEGWTVQIAFNGDISLNNGWNGNYQVNGNVLVISSMDYNGHIDKGGIVENVGFILQGQEGLAPADG